MFLKESLARVPWGKWFQIRKKKHSIKEVETNKTKQQITIEHLVIPQDKKAPKWLASFFLRFIYFVNMSVLPLCVCVRARACVSGVFGGQERELNPLKLELQWAIMWLLGTKLRSSARAPTLCLWYLSRSQQLLDSCSEVLGNNLKEFPHTL